MVNQTNIALLYQHICKAFSHTHTHTHTHKTMRDDKLAPITGNLKILVRLIYIW